MMQNLYTNIYNKIDKLKITIKNLYKSHISDIIYIYWLNNLFIRFKIHDLLLFIIF